MLCNMESLIVFFPILFVLLESTHVKKKVGAKTENG
jgi:hypothetical protein